MDSYADSPSDKQSVRTDGAPGTGGTRTSRFTVSGHQLRTKLTSKHGWLGDYDYSWLCTPTLPIRHSTRTQHRIPPFYALEDDIPLLSAIVGGFQHALAILPGLMTPPTILANALNVDDATQAYMISSCLIASGLLSLVQMSRLKLWGNYYLGTGLLSVVGTSSVSLTTALSIFETMYANGSCPSSKANSGRVIRAACPDAYGFLLGTSLICSFLEIFISFVPVRTLQRIFPPIVTGPVVLLIGASLIGSVGIPSWGGGSNCMSFPTTGIFQTCPTTLAPRPLPWGSPELIGLGFLSFISIILTELFGSPFLKNVSILVGLAVGCIVAGATGYIDGSSIHNAPPLTFLWVHTFKLRVYIPAILPMLAVYTALALEAVGNITGSAEASRIEVKGTQFESRIQGGVLSDGIGGFLSALFTVPPVTVFAQNNALIVITRCANRSAGRACCAFLVLFGILGKLSGVILAIPNPVLGGVTTFLFGSVAVSGLRILSYISWTRRDRFVLSGALGLGMGDLIVPGIFKHLFNGVDHPNSGLLGLFDSITIILGTPFLIAGAAGVILNLILPQDLFGEEAQDGRQMKEQDPVEASHSSSA